MKPWAILPEGLWDAPLAASARHVVVVLGTGIRRARKGFLLGYPSACLQGPRSAVCLQWGRQAIDVAHNLLPADKVYCSMDRVRRTAA
jgi:hypothetical protein